jgi:hypothetical protein
MLIIKINKKEGFFCPSDVLIFTPDGLIFYEKKNQKEGVYFNLPKGEYYTNCKLNKIGFINYELPKLPPKEKNKSIGKFKINIAGNPNKASIFINSGKIIIDNEIMNKNKYVWVFILLHELGHYFYYNEHSCDLFASRIMLKNGYNPSQIASAIDEGLSSNSNHRKLTLFKKIIQ